MDKHVKDMLDGNILNVQFKKVNNVLDMKDALPGTPMMVRKRDKYMPCTLVKTSYVTKRIKVMVVKNCFDRTDVESYVIREEDLKKGEVYVCA